MIRNMNLQIDIDSRKVKKYNDLIKVSDTVNLSITLLSKGNTVSLTGETVKLFLKKEDNKKVEQSVSISGNTITGTLSAQATTTVGQVVGELTFTGSNTKLTSSSFIFNVEGSVNNEVLEESKDEVDVLNRIEASITKANNTVETYKNNINAVAGTTEAVAALTEMKGLISKAETNNTKLTNANAQATKNIEALNEIGDATNLAKDVESLKQQTLENNYTSIETDSVLTKLESAKDGFVDNLVIGGKTLQNIFSMGESIYPSTVTKNGTEYFTSTDVIQSLIKATLKPLTEYTVLAYMKSSNNLTNANNNRFFRVDTLSTGVTINGVSGTITQSYLPIKFKFTTTSDATIRVVLRNFYSDIDASLQSNTMYVKDIMILEGDWTDKEIPSYFEGIKSVGEDDGNIIKLNTISHNIFDGDRLFANIIKNGNMSDGLKFTQINKSAFNIKGTVTSAPTVVFEDMKSYFSNGKSYTIRGNYVRFEITYYDGTKSWPKNFVYNKATTSSIKVYFQLGSSSVGELYDEIIYVQVEEGGQSDYSDCKSDTLQLQLSEPLRALPNGIKDTIDYEKGIVTRNIGKIIFNASETNINKRNDGNGTNTISFNVPFSLQISKSYCISDKFNYDASTSNGIEGAGFDDASFFVEILRSKLTTQDVAGFKAWLQANPITVYYQLANPTTEKISNAETLQTFKDGYIQLENSIAPVVDLDFSTNYPSIVANMKEKLDAIMDRMATVEAYITAQAAASVLNNI